MKPMNRINQSSTENQENSKIIERLNKIINREEEEILVKDSPFYKNKYFIYGSFFC
jgi:hypothetical protein